SAPPSSTPIGKVADIAAASLRYADLGHGIQVCVPCCTGSTHTRATASPRGEGVRCASYARRRESRSPMPCVVGTGCPLGSCGEGCPGSSPRAALSAALCLRRRLLTLHRVEHRRACLRRLRKVAPHSAQTLRS